MKNNRLWQNLRSLLLRNPYRQHFTSQHRTVLSQQIGAAEIGHRGEIRLVVETQLPITLILKHVSARQRAISWFSDLRVWDTEENSGILLYLLLSERKIEIVADRGIAKLVEQVEWDRICTQLQTQLGADHIHDGLHQALQDLGNLLRQHYPIQDTDTNPDELSNELIFIP
ncbi:TPM domain-containing protein [Undibacterium flavidum]|uniref:TPM domain-containing protein n=1 Tax=Undibacterium flavidum TaxID=2762297 RepID=A0ABR6YGN8_9BURK|nr:TPM domain-containing protein [Undibacterium flavidum]MBC3875755.1 TPM domain-containing protein [Undibacterium flavidum]